MEPYWDTHNPYFIVKRLLDLTVALAVAAPAALLVGVGAFAMKRSSAGPAFFVQERPGYKGKAFRLYKLRTMIIETERNGQTLGDMQRTTKMGSLLRKLSIDELPQLWNILKGEMSFLGPRPLLPKYLPLYSTEQMRRHDVPPGISGWAQVNGRNAITWEEKFRCDVWYVDNVSLRVDLGILVLTIGSVVMRTGVNAGASETMGEFRGAQAAEGGQESAWEEHREGRPA
ncbi:MAG: sugar transferase [Bacillota bacterium]|nr:sugar transferase [Bacillota bacterium]